MKTAISVPDETFRLATERAAALGVSRSELFSRAVKRYLDQLDAESLTDRIDFAIDLAGDDEATGLAVVAGRRTLGADAEGW